jgi:hypothetical protein
MIIRCFGCPATMVTEGPDDNINVRTWLCSECVHERGLTPKLAERIAIEDAKWGNPASIWEACPPEMMKMLLVPIIDAIEVEAENAGIEEGNPNRDSWMAHKIAHRLVGIMNHIWFGPEVLLR